MPLPTENSLPTVPQSQAAGTAPRSSYGAKAVASFVPRITQKAFEKHGFAAAALITDWAIVVGQELARATRPERLKWPRSPGDGLSLTEAEKGRPGATLYLAVDAALALEVQYRVAQIVERVNGYFGYAAITDVRVRQVHSGFEDAHSSASPSAQPPLRRRLSDARETGQDRTHEALKTIDDEPLRAALARLGRSIDAAKG